MDMTPHDPVERVLRSAPRFAAPAFSIDDILERGRRQRRRAAGYALAAIVVLFGLVTLIPRTPPPPVHLELEFRDVPAEASGERNDPAELFGP